MTVRLTKENGGCGAHDAVAAGSASDGWMELEAWVGEGTGGLVNC